jgi:hypothetical protein
MLSELVSALDYYRYHIVTRSTVRGMLMYTCLSDDVNRIIPLNSCLIIGYFKFFGLSAFLSIR